MAKLRDTEVRVEFFGKAAWARSTFVRGFLLPLVAGGEVHVGAPLGARGLSRLLEGARDERAEAEVQDARWAVASELQLRPIPPALDEEALRLAAAVHDLLFLYHPAAGSPA